MIRQIENFLINWLQSKEIFQSDSNYYADWLMFIVGLFLVYAIFYCIRRLLLFIIKKIINKTGSLSQKSLLDNHLYDRLALIPSLILINVLINLLFEMHSATKNALLTLSSIIGVIIFCSIIFAFLNSFDYLYNKTKYAKQGSIKGIIQAIKTVIYIIASIFIICLLFSVPMGTLLTVLGGASAVMMLVFKDSILGLMSGIQLSINHMILPGDWIEMPQSNADGIVIDISQITVKVKNWDNTITTIPTYDLISKPVINWRGMSEAGVRRIKRSIYIDMTSVKFCDEAMLSRFREIQYMNDYTGKNENADKHTENDQVKTNVSYETNLSAFRAYLQRYLNHHPMISHESTLMVRQLQPTNIGIPIEIYVFAKTTVWTEYEEVQSTIFEHIISSVPRFDLLIFQTPSWNDYRMRSSAKEQSTL